jgi:hypothetical protein
MEDATGSTALAVIAPRINHVLIDHENVQPSGLNLLDRPDVRVWIFVGASQTKISSELAITAQQMGERARYVRISGNGANALDFHIAYYLGKLVHQTPEAYFHVISKDTGYDPLIDHLRTSETKVYRVPAIEQMVIFPQKPKLPAVPAAKAAQPTAPKVASINPAPASAVPPLRVVTVVAENRPAVAVASIAATAKSAMNAAQRLAHIKDNLNKNKKARPAKKATLRNHVMAQFQKAINPQQADELIASLSKSGVLKLEGEKVRYC